MKAILALVVGWQLMGPGAGAVERFVSPRGNDGADGLTVTRALATVAKGASMLQPGDTLTILPGEYHEAVAVRNLAGTREKPIVIRAQRPGTVLLRGDEEVGGWRAASGSAGVFETIFGKAAEGVADPVRLAHFTAAAAPAEIEAKPGSFFQQAKTGRLLVRTRDARPPGLLLVSTTNGCGLALENCSHITVIGLAFTGYQHADNRTLFGSRTRWGFIASKCDGITVQRCVSYLNSGGFCLSSNTADSVIEDCFAFANTSRTVGISNQILGWAVKNCIFRGNRIEGFNNPSSSEDQITFYSSAGQVNVLENNVAVRGGYMDKGDAQNVRVTGNLSTGPRPQYYKTPDASNMKVSYNDAHRVEGQFADPVNGDFRLLADSPWRGRGLDGSDPGPAPCREEVFFVSPDGDDAATGLSPARPWKTLRQAGAKARPGDTVFLLPGVYGEALVPARSGTAEQPIRFVRRGDGRVVLDGGGTLPVGIDLSGRSHIEIDGVAVINFSRCAVEASKGAGLTLSNLQAGGGIKAADIRELTVRHCNLEASAGAALRLERCELATVMGNYFGAGGGPRLVCDEATLAELWSDRNHFALGAALAEAAGLAQATLREWQKASGLDEHSGTGEAGVERARNGGAWLQAESPLPGRGPFAAAIGSFRRLAVEQAVPIEEARLHSATATTANLECRTPAPVAVALEWGARGTPGETRAALEGVSHSISLTGLTPGRTYQARFTTSAREARTLLATDREALETTGKAAAGGGEITFTTPAKVQPPRVFHVSPEGDDGADGQAEGSAWRTLSHAAATAVAGDTVLLHSGTYDELVTVRSTGDAGAPLTFRPAPGAVVWMTGSDRLRSTAFLVKEKSHVVIDGFHFRDFLSVDSNHERVVAIMGGAHHTVRRCFYDGRVPSGYMNVFLGVTGSSDFLVENCVIMLGMGEGLALKESPRALVRHCVFYNNNLRALSIYGDQPGVPVTLSHNLVCAVIPAKGGSPFFRVRQLQNLTSDYNGYFDRIPEAERGIVEAAFVGTQEVGAPKPGAYRGKDFTLAELRTVAGQEKHSIFGNPGLRVVRELSPPVDKDNPENNDRTWNARWMSNELHQSGAHIEPLDFRDFFAAPESAFARSAAGEAIGLEAGAFEDLAAATDRGEGKGGPAR